jgi:DNA-binding CsgD family transcriptional regulator
VLSYLADAALVTRHRAVAEAIEPLLRPYAGLLVYLPGLVCYGAASRYLGKVHDVLGHAEAARSHYEAALELDERTGWRCWIAHSRYALGSHLLERRRRADRQRGVGLVESAKGLAEELGMSSLAGRCEAARGRSGADGAQGPQRALTPREHEVLSLVAEGWSNREIGARLHASQHTVANHVRAILAKTGCANRTEATAWALRNGQGPAR